VEKLSELQAHGCVFAGGEAVGDGETSGVADGLAAGRIGPLSPIGPIKARVACPPYKGHAESLECAMSARFGPSEK
jgi:hypothetical protein